MLNLKSLNLLYQKNISVITYAQIVFIEKLYQNQILDQKKLVKFKYHQIFQFPLQEKNLC